MTSVDRSTGHLLLGVSLVILLLGSQVAAQRLIIEDERPPAGIFATFGVGVIDVEDGTGLDIPVGITAISPAHRVMATFNFFDLGLLQGSDGDTRFRRFFDTRFGQELCVDTATNQLVSYNRCAGETNLLRSLSVDVNLLPVETVIVGSKPGSLHTESDGDFRSPTPSTEPSACSFRPTTARPRVSVCPWADDTSSSAFPGAMTFAER